MRLKLLATLAMAAVLGIVLLREMPQTQARPLEGTIQWDIGEPSVQADDTIYASGTFSVPSGAIDSFIKLWILDDLGELKSYTMGMDHLKDTWQGYSAVYGPGYSLQVDATLYWLMHTGDPYQQTSTSTVDLTIPN